MFANADTMSSYVYVRRTCLDTNTLWSATFVGSEIHSSMLEATVIRFLYWYGSENSRARYILLQGAKVPSMVPSSERTWE